MGVINFLKTNCKHCYSCVRACKVKAVKVKNDQAEILEERCIACGKCIKACPKNAKEIQSDICIIKKFLENGETIAVSLAPSFVVAFEELSNKICDALKSIGFKYIEETAIGAILVNKVYEEYASTLDGTCYITSCCPSLNELIQKHHSELIPSLVPVISPMACHGRLMKKKYGQDTKVVFIGPCISKKNEAKEEDSIDAVITFEELISLFQYENIDLEKCEEIPLDAIATRERTYPMLGGITNSMDKNNIKRELLHVDGIEQCLTVLKKIKNGRFKDRFIEMSLCDYGCINGPAMPKSELIIQEKQQLIRKYENVNEKYVDPIEGFYNEISMEKTFEVKLKPLKEPSEKEIREILESIGKYSSKDELNCGTCGYDTCRDKAIAVYNGMAELTMCLPYMKQKAENLSNVIFDITPTIIVVVNKKNDIVDLNPAAETFFKIKKKWAVGISLSTIMEVDMINELIQSNESSISKKAYLKEQNATVLESIIKIKDSDSMLIVINDFTETLNQEEKYQQMKINAVEVAQYVIDKQMRVAQEIASLLGETTAETKVSLTKLKRLVQGEEVD